MRTRSVAPKLIALAVVPLLLLGVTVADAASGPGQTITGCYARRSGRLRVLRRGRCHANEREISWNQPQSFASLTDVAVDAPTDGQLATFDAGSGKWTNKNPDLSQTMQALNGKAITDDGTLDDMFDGDLTVIPNIASVHATCSSGTADVTMTLTGPLDQTAWTSVDGGPPVFQDSDFAGPASMLLQGANTSGGHVTEFMVQRLIGGQDWLADIRVGTGPQSSRPDECRYVVTGTLVRNS